MTIYDGRESFYQWDLNQKITSNTLAVGDKIHFFNMRQTNALVVKAYELDGKIVADVPNILLQNALPLKVWKYVYGENSAQTIEEHIFKVEQRPQPYDYFYTETELYELRRDVLRAVEDADNAVAQLNEGLANATRALELATLAEKTSSENEQARVTAEEQRKSNETVRKTAETKRNNSETSRVNAESLRVEAENERVSSESLRLNNESTRVIAENERIANEKVRQSNETNRGTAESTREKNETTRQTNETNRVNAESKRVTAENLRVEAESKRVTAETNRVTAEQDRVDAETSRQSAELERQSAETLRQTTFEQSYNNVSNALKGVASGEVIRVDDVSPVEHLVRTKVSGKNLFNQSALNMPNKEIMGITISYLADEDCFLINGTATGTSGYCTTYINLLGELNSNYTASTKYISGSVSVPSGQFAVAYFGSSDTVDKGSVNWLLAKLENNNTSKTSILTRKYIGRFWFYFTDGVSFDNYKVKIQLEQSDTATEYTPYVDPTTVTVTRCGKNLIDLSTVCNGFFTHNEDDSYTFTMGSIAGERFSKKAPFYLPANIEFFISTDVVAHTTEYETLYMILTHPDGTQSYPGVGFATGKRAITLDKPVTAIQFYLQSSEAAGTYITFKNFMFEKGSDVTDFEPYNGTVYTPSADGTVDIGSVSPTMTLLTDTAGVTIEAEYNQDVNVVIENMRSDYQSQIDSLKAQVTELTNKEG